MNLYSPVVFIFGACLGSFLNVIALRFIIKKEIVYTPSACPDCGYFLHWYELIPIISFLTLRGRCKNCKKQISPQYPLIECIAGLIAVLIFWQVQAGVYSLLLGTLLFCIAAILLVLTIIDFRTFLLPDFFITLLACFCIMALNFADHAPIFALYGVLIGSGFLLAIWLLTKGQGIGFGDVKLMLPIGLLFGGMGAITILFLAFMMGGFIGSMLLLTKKATPKTAVPFGPYLVLATLFLIAFPSLPDNMLALLGW